MDHKIQTILQGYGLNDKEILLYLSSLKLGPVPMSKLASVAKSKRSTAYLTYKTLQDRGLMSDTKNDTGHVYYANDPSVLSQKASKVLADINSITPHLRAVESSGSGKPHTANYEGIKSYKEIVEDVLLHPNTTMWAIGPTSEAFDTLSKEYDKDYFIPKRIELRIKAKILALHSDKKDFIDMDNRKELREIRFLPPGIDLKTLKIVYANKVVVIYTKHQPLISVITDQLIADDEKKILELLWQNTTPNKTKKSV